MIFVRFDENISPKIGRCVELMKSRRDLVVEWPAADGTLGAPDVHWLQVFGTRGGKRDRRIAISADGFVDAERAVAETAGVTVFYTPTVRYWRPLKSTGQAAYVLRWLDRIIALAEASEPGVQFALPATFRTSAQVRIYKPILGRSSRRGSQLRRRPRPKPAPLFDE